MWERALSIFEGKPYIVVQKNEIEGEYVFELRVPFAWIKGTRHYKFKLAFWIMQFIKRYWRNM